MKRFLSVFLSLFAGVYAFAGISGFTCLDSRTVVFNTDSDAKMLLKLCSPSVVKIHYSFDGTFPSGMPTPAVVQEDLGDIKAEVNESGSMYELFTPDLRITLDKDPLVLRIYNSYQKVLLETAPESFSKKEDFISASFVLPRDEHFFGLGEKGGLLDRRGATFTMWNSDKPGYDVDEDPLYKSIPFYLSTRSYGLFFDNSYKTFFDFGDTKRDRTEISAYGGDMIFYIMAGTDYKDILGKYIHLTGKAVMPPKWALGFSVCRGLLTNEKLTREIAGKLRALDIPCDVIYQDIGWTDALQSFSWTDRYSDPKAMLNDLHKDGFHVIVSQDPVISRTNALQYAEGENLGIFAKDIRTGRTYDMPWPWGGNCAIVDFTDTSAASWWGNWQQKAIRDGVDGFWTDMGEPAWCNEEATDRLNIVHHAGPHAKIHNVYGLYWDKVVTTEFEKRNPDKRLFQMTRAGFSGIQRYTFSWTGDCGNPRNITDSWENLAYQIPMMLSAGLGGIPFITGDITGYCGSINDYQAASEIYIRWMQFGLFTPLSRSHHEGNTAVEPWEFSPLAMECARKCIELKYSLMPYIYTYAREAYDTGIPIMRAMFLEFPFDKQCRKQDFQFMYGSELLVAPVVEEGATSRTLYLPKGRWYDWYNPGTMYNGGKEIEVETSIDRAPMFVRSSSIVPTTVPGRYIGENPDSDIILNVFPETERTAEFTLYEDDGETLGYKKDCCLRRTFSCHKSADGPMTVNVSAAEASGGYVCPETHRNFVFRILSDSKPKSVRMGTRKLKYQYTKATGIIEFSILDTSETAQISINF